jgi:DNA-binding transcriptional ArsR family regulator
MADIFSVIADPTRRDILLILLEKYQSEDEISVSEIVTRLETSQPTVSKHLKVLREAELVSVREDGQHRFYALNPEPLEIVEDFVIPFLSADFDTEVSFEYVTDDGIYGEDEVLSDGISNAAASLGRVAADAEHQVKELVARFRYRN